MDLEKLSVEDGSYFLHARRWYDVIYLLPIADRFFFILVTSISLFTFVVSILALMRLMPLAPAEPFLYYSPDAVNLLPRIIPLQDGLENPDFALKKYLLSSYVQRRESYSRAKVINNASMIMNNSDAETYRIYRQFMDTANANSPIVVYGAYAERKIRVENVLFIPSRKNNNIAEVTFAADIYSAGEVQTSYHKARMEFSYQPIMVQRNTNAEDERALKVTPMKLVVTGYQVKKRV